MPPGETMRCCTSARRRARLRRATALAAGANAPARARAPSRQRRRARAARAARRITRAALRRQQPAGDGRVDVQRLRAPSPSLRSRVTASISSGQVTTSSMLSPLRQRRAIDVGQLFLAVARIDRGRRERRLRAREFGVGRAIAQELPRSPRPPPLPPAPASRLRPASPTPKRCRRRSPMCSRWRPRSPRCAALPPARDRAGSSPSRREFRSPRRARALGGPSSVP